MGTMPSNADQTFDVSVGNTNGVAYSQANYVSQGYGQLEPNHLSAQRTGQIYAQLPVASDINIVENGQFMKYDYVNKVCNFTGLGEFMLVYNPEKLYRDFETKADFAMVKKNYSGRVYSAANDQMPEGSVMTPRLFKTNVGDIFTTNLVMGSSAEDPADIVVGATLTPNDIGILAVTTSTEGMLWAIVKVYTLGDGQRAVKLQRVQ